MKKEQILAVRGYRIIDAIAHEVMASREFPAGSEVDTRAFAEGTQLHTPEAVTRILAKLTDHVVLMPRDELERNELYRHFINYDVFLRPFMKDTNATNMGVGLEILLYGRTTKGGEAGLFGKVSGGIGGHVELADVITPEATPSQIDLERTLDRARLRELDEEITVEQRDEDVTRYLGGGDYVQQTEVAPCAVATLVDTDAVGAVHLGIANIYLLPTGTRVEMKEPAVPEGVDPVAFREHVHLGFKALTPELLTQYPLENWTAMLVRALLDNFGAPKVTVMPTGEPLEPGYSWPVKVEVK